ncbi:ABC transporter substrate-binding protein [Serratia nematodiphila]|uniref:ABC transporter substrate-binding protein n=1 Tax=Enterobacteriaceae TaxID=543 RepID=UPI0017C01E77|nr:ABC transporter substrate-binding protein [Klebsiella variicola]HAB5395178.1 transporter substrate-binding domain-containing protein [Salmonella enterica subsp. enterica serovar Mbandaka]
MKTAIKSLLFTLPLLMSAAGYARTLEPGALTIGSDLTYPPYNYLQNNQPAGFDVELMSMLAGVLHLRLEVKDTRFTSLILGVKSRKFDAVASTLYVTPERAQQVAFLPYMKTGGAFLVPASGSFAPKKPEDLCGKRVASIKGGAWIARLNKVSASYCQEHGAGAITVMEFPTSPEATQALMSGAVDVQYEDVAVAKASVEKTGGRLKISSTRIIYPVVVGLAVDKKNSELLTALKNALVQKTNDGSYGQLLEKYNLQMPSAQEVEQALAGTL